MKSVEVKRKQSDHKYKELDQYLKHWFGMFTKEEKKDWVDNNIDLLEILEAKEKGCIK